MRRYVFLLAFLLLLTSAYALSCPPGTVSDWHLCPDYELNVYGYPSEFNLSVPPELSGVVESITAYVDCGARYSDYVPLERTVYLGRFTYETNTRYELYDLFSDLRDAGGYYLSPFLGYCYYDGYRHYGPCYLLGYRFARLLRFSQGFPKCTVRVRLCTYTGCFESTGEGSDVVDVRFPEFKLAFSFRMHSEYNEQYLSIPYEIYVDPDTGEPYDASVPDFGTGIYLPNLIVDLNEYGLYVLPSWEYPFRSEIKRSSVVPMYMHQVSPAEWNSFEAFLREWLTDPYETNVVDLNAYRLEDFYCTPVSYLPAERLEYYETYCYFPAYVSEANLYFFDTDYMKYFKIGVFDPNDILVSIDLNTRHIDIDSPAGLTVSVSNLSDTNLPISIRLNISPDFYSADYTGFYLHPDESNASHITIFAVPSKRFPLEVNVYAGPVLVRSETYQLYFPFEFNAQQHWYCVNNRLYAYVPGFGFRKVKDCEWGCNEEGTACEPSFWVKHQKIISFIGAGIAGELASEAVIAELGPLITSPWKLLALGLAAFGAVMIAWYLGQDLYQNHPDCPLAQWAPLLSVILPFLIGAFETLIALGLLWIICLWSGK